MKKILFNDPNNESLWSTFETELKALAKKHNISLLEDSGDNKILIHLEWQSGRGFDGIKESFVIDKNEWANFKSILTNREIYFGEIAGKHSEVYGELEEGDIQVVDSKSEVINFMKNHGTHNRGAHSFLDIIHDTMMDNKDSELENFKKIYKNL